MRDKSDSNARVEKEDTKSKQPVSNQVSSLFFSQKQNTLKNSNATNASPPEIQGSQEIQQPSEKLTLNSTTDILLAAILKELQTHTMIELKKLMAQQEHDQDELKAAETLKEQESERFDTIRNSMYM